MKQLKQDVIVGLMFMAGLYSFIAGEFIISNVLFASATLVTKVDLTNKHP